MPTDRYGQPYDPDDFPDVCDCCVGEGWHAVDGSPSLCTRCNGEGRHVPVTWGLSMGCHGLALEACWRTAHPYTGDVKDSRGIWHGTCECGHGRYPLGGPAGDEDPVVG